MMAQNRRRPDRVGLDVSDIKFEKDMKDHQFVDDYDKLEIDVDDYRVDGEDEEQDQLEQLVQQLEKEYKIPELNKVTEIVRCEQFAKDADEFMKKSGEDNIFRSSIHWMIPQLRNNPAKLRKNEAKERQSLLVRTAIDGIHMQINKAQTEISRIRSQKSKYSMCFNELTYLETQICQVSRFMMILLKDPHPRRKTVKVQPEQNLRPANDRQPAIENLFYKYAQDQGLNNDDGGNLTYEDLLEFLKRCVFKAATIISTFNQIARSNLKAIDAHLEQLFYPVDEDEEQERRETDQDSEEEEFDESDDDDDDDENADEIHDQQRDFMLRQCLAKQYNRLQKVNLAQEVLDEIEERYTPQERDSRFTKEQLAVDTEISEGVRQQLTEKLNLLKIDIEIGSVLLNDFATTADTMKNIEDKKIKEFIMLLDYQNSELQAIVKNFELLLSPENFITLRDERVKSKVLKSVHIFIKIFYYLLLVEEKKAPKNQKSEKPGIKLVKLLQEIKKWCEPQKEVQTETQQLEQTQISEEGQTEEEKKKEQAGKKNEEDKKKERERAKLDKRIESFKKAKLFILTQIWLNQLPAFFRFFADEKIFDQKDLSNQTCMKLFCENVMTILETEKKHELTIPTEKDFEYILTGNQELMNQDEVLEQNAAFFYSEGFDLVLDTNQEESKNMESGYRGMHNVPRTILLKMINILDDPLVFGLSPYEQATLVRRLCFFMREQIKDIRLRGRRSTILKDFYKREDVESDIRDSYQIEAERHKESLAFDGYQFLRAYFRWEGTVNRQIHNLRLQPEHRQQYYIYKKQAKDVLLQNSDMLVEWLFVMWDKQQEEVNKPKVLKAAQKKSKLTNEEEIDTMVMFQLLLNFNSENIEMIIGTKSAKVIQEYKPSRKNMQSMLQFLQSKLKENVMFEEPLKEHCMNIRFKLLTKFCRNIREKLIAENVIKPKVKEYRPLFAYTWIIMLQNHIHMRQNELERIGDDLVKDTTRGYDNGAGKLMQEVIDFWHQTRAKVCKNAHDTQILVPSQSLSHELRDDYIPKLIEIAFAEYDKNYNTLTHLLQFLFYYQQITQTIERERQNPDDPKLIQMLPVLVKISERFLKEKIVKGKIEQTAYQKFALEYHKWLYCGNGDCKKCQDRKREWDKSTNNRLFDNKNSPLLNRISLAFMRLESDDLNKHKTFEAEEKSQIEIMREFKKDIEGDFKEIEQQIFFNFQSEKQNWDYDKDNDMFIKNDINNPKPKYAVLEPEKEDNQQSNEDAGEEQKSAWTEEQRKCFVDTNWLEADSIRNLLKLFIKNPDASSEVNNTDLEQLIKKIKDKEFLSNLPEIFDPMGFGGEKYDTQKRWSEDYLKELKANYNRRNACAVRFDRWLTHAHFGGDPKMPEGKRMTGQQWTYYELTHTLASDIAKANKFHKNFMDFNVAAKRKDLIQEAFCKYALLKKKLDLNIYDKIEHLLKDTIKIQELNKEISGKEVIFEEIENEETDETRVKKSKDQMFMKAEQPFVMHETLRWIKKRAEEKKNDKNFLRNFRLKLTAEEIQEDLDNLDKYQVSIERERQFQEAKKLMENIKNDEAASNTNEENDEFYGILMQAENGDMTTLNNTYQNESTGELNDRKNDEQPDVQQSDKPNGNDKQLAKWNAWKSQQGVSQNDAKVDYIAKVHNKIFDHDYQRSKVIEHLSTVKIKKKNYTFYPLEAFKLKQEQIDSLLKQNALELQDRNLKTVEETEKADRYIDEMRKIAERVSGFNEKEFLEVKAPMYCQYYHIQFWGKHFSPELTYNSDGFIIRRNDVLELQDMKNELHELFPFLSALDKDKVRIVSRKSPLVPPDPEMNEKPEHNQEIALIAICFYLEPLTDEVIDIYKDDRNKEQKQIDLVKVQAAHNRQNFQKFFKQNYKRYFYKTSFEPNDQMKKQCDLILKAELKSWAEEDDNDEGKDFIKRDKFLAKVGPRILTMAGQEINQAEIEKMWTKCAKEELKRLKQSGQKYEDDDENTTTIVQIPVECTFSDTYSGMFNFIKKEKIDENPFYYDSVLCILEVEKPFPTGFFFQKVKNLDKWKIVGAKKQNYDLREQTSLYKHRIEEYIKSKDRYKQRLLENPTAQNALDERQEAALNEFVAKAKDVYISAEEQLISDVSGGAGTIMRQFFPTNGFYQLNRKDYYRPQIKRKNDNNKEEPSEIRQSLSTVSSETRKDIFHEVLKIFLNIEEQFKQVQNCLNCMSEVTNDPDVRAQMKKFSFVKPNEIEIFQSYQDKNVDLLEKIRVDHKIDYKLANERDQMDVEQE